MRIYCRRYFLFCWAIIVYALCSSVIALADVQTVEFGGKTWEQLKGKHFIVYYQHTLSEAGAEGVLREAEKCYQDIGETLGFTRFSNYWTWDQRAKIFIFPDQDSFVRTTGAPRWKTGYSDRDSFLFKSRAIVTYQQDKTIFNELFPHEITHLILHDFIPSDNLPVWIDEGIAQLNEKHKREIVDKVMRVFVKQGAYLPLDSLNRCNIRTEKDPRRIEVFYTESLSVLNFLRGQYGADRFRSFCRNLRDGEPVQEALRDAYPQRFQSLKDLQNAWVKFLLDDNKRR